MMASRWQSIVRSVAALLLVTAIGALTRVHGPASSHPLHPNLVQRPAGGSEYYVAPDGVASNAGTMSEPLDLASAIAAAGPARPGDTIWLRGGLYRGSFVSELTGTEGAPIVLRQYPGERATIDSDPSPTDALHVKGAHAWYWGFEVRSSAINRYSTAPFAADVNRAGGVVSHAPGTRFINLVIHDMMNGLAVWASSPDSEVYGNVIYNNGYLAADRGHGHGIYAQNRDGRQLFSDNILFNGFSHGLHAYGSDAAHLNNIQLEGNIIFNSGVLGPTFARNILIGGGRTAEHPVVLRNYTYFDDALEHPGGENNFGYSGGCLNLELRDNYFAHIRKYPLVLQGCTGTITGNVFLGWASDELIRDHGVNSYATAAPTTERVFVRPNKYERGRANVAVYNWSQRVRLPLDLSQAGLRPGETFEIRDVQDIFGPPVYSGRYDGRPVELPMDSTRVAQPIGNVAKRLAHTPRTFGAFVVVPLEPSR